ncbi:primosomal protein N' [Lacibacterium aquatile]|uniref:Replication restart protein PriA n=1 Tax=Lacibacterium aquatile TaxID=1168082 RepID=A0ABW5DXG9_9PROT
MPAAAVTLQPTEPVTRVSVLLPLPLAGPYTYAVPEGEEVSLGSVISVPFGKRVLPGVIWDTPPDAAVPALKLKEIGLPFDVPPMTGEMRRFIDWVAGYTLTPQGAVLRMALSVPAALEAPSPTEVLAASGLQLPGKLTAARQKVLEVLKEGPAQTSAALAELAGVSTSVVKTMVKAGLLTPHALPEFAFSPRQPDPGFAVPTFSPEQQEVADTVVAAVEAESFAVSLLDGVTGSGKTEVYFAAIAAALQAGKQVLVLLPEIALSAQWLSRFEGRFGVKPQIWHSEIGPVARRKAWRRIAYGQVPVVVGARSALFLPLNNLGLIVVDEEHEGSFKQEDGVLYQARDMAVVRAQFAKVPIILASATPSLESLANVEAGRYTRLELGSRHGPAGMPEIQAIDLRKDPPPRGRWIAPGLERAVTQTLEAGEQAMLFLNRRGYAPLTLCRTCGHRFACPNCSSWLVEHRARQRLICHHCGHTEAVPPACPSCADTGSLVPCGPGVERLAEEAQLLWPDARLAIMSSDMLGSPEKAEALVSAVQAREVDILIGTAMMAKGHHFPHLTLVGVVDADLGLGGGDLRAGERTFQLLHQVSGRAGRAEHPGRVLLQTAAVEHPVLQALLAGDRDGFIAQEMEERRYHGMPPYGRLAAIIVSAPDAGVADTLARALARAAPRMDDLLVLGPAPAPLALLRGMHRRRLLVKAPRALKLQPILADWLSAVPIPNAARVAVDIDPYSFL